MAGNSEYVALSSNDEASKAWLERWRHRSDIVVALLQALLDRHGNLRPYADSSPYAAAFRTLGELCDVSPCELSKNDLIKQGLLLESGLPSGLTINYATPPFSSIAASYYIAQLKEEISRERPDISPPSNGAIVLDPPFGYPRMRGSAPQR